MNQQSSPCESPETTGRIDSCPVCGRALPLRLPDVGEAGEDWICNGCQARYCAVLDDGAPADLLQNVRPAVIRFSRECLRQPSEAVAQFVSEMAGRSDRRASHRHAMLASVAVVPISNSYHPAGDPFMAVARDVSTRGMALVHTQPVSTDLVVVELKNAAGNAVQVVMKVLRCRTLGDFYEIAGAFVDRLNSAQLG